MVRAGTLRLRALPGDLERMIREDTFAAISSLVPISLLEEKDHVLVAATMNPSFGKIRSQVLPAEGSLARISPCRVIRSVQN